jgi:nitroreductase
MYRNRRPAAHQTEASYNKMMGAADHLANHLHEVPVMIIAGLMTPAAGHQPPASDAARVAAARPLISGASVYPAVQNMLLACRALGLGSVLTTIHAYYNDDVRAALNLPEEFRTYGCCPLAIPRQASSTDRSSGVRSAKWLSRTDGVISGRSEKREAHSAPVKPRD